MVLNERFVPSSFNALTGFGIGLSPVLVVHGNRGEVEDLHDHPSRGDPDGCPEKSSVL